MAGMKKTGMNKMGGMKGGPRQKHQEMLKAKIMKKRMGEKTMKKNVGKKTDMQVKNFKDMMFEKFGGGKT